MTLNKKVIFLCVATILSVGLLKYKNRIKEEIVEKNIKALSYNIHKKIENLENVKVIDFNLGKSIINEKDGVDIPYNIRGIMAIPKGNGKYPVVFINHGHYNSENLDERFDDGFKYLAEGIAQRGYIAISLDINPYYSTNYKYTDKVERLNYIFNDYFTRLIQANKGNDVGFGIDLKNKLDLENIALIGHSKAGQGVFQIAKDQFEKGNKNIKGILSIAPLEKEIVDNYIDIPTSFVVPEYNDENFSDGFSMHDKISNYKDRKNLVSLVYLIGANNDFFNSVVREECCIEHNLNESKKLHRDTLNKNKKVHKDSLNKSKKLSKEEQRDFLVKYAIDFLDMTIKNKFKNTVFDINAPTVNKLFDYDVLTLLSLPEREAVNIIDIENLNNISTKNLKLKNVVESSFLKLDKAVPFIDPRFNKELKLLNLSWYSKGESISIKTLKNKDFSKFNSLVLKVAVDPANYLNKVEKNQQLTVMLTSGNGKKSKILLGEDTTPLRYVNGKVLSSKYLNDKYHIRWNNYTPLSEIRIPLKYFDNIDLNEVISVDFLFNKTNSGSIMIESIKLQK